MTMYLVLIIVFLEILLLLSYRRNINIFNKMKRLIKVRDAALDIANKVVDAQTTADLYQYILETCLKLIPKAKFGSILMFNTEGLLIAKASVGFNEDEINNFKLKLEESFIYIAAKGKIAKTVIINNLQDIVLEQNIVESGDKGFAIRSEVCSPLYINNELVGLLCVDGDRSNIFSEEDIYILDYMSDQISIVINNQNLYKQIFHLSRYDGLTNLLNRTSFESEVNKLLSTPSIDTHNIYFVLIDLDNFKKANDAFGHDYGDEVIINFSLIIKNHLGENDLCARYGGDEFVAIFHSEYSLVEKTLEDIKRSFMYCNKIYKEGNFTPDFSYGIVSFKEGLCSLDTLYKLADTRMYETKNNKR